MVGRLDRFIDWLSVSLAPYLLALGVTAATTLVLLIFRQAITPAVVALLYILPVGLSTALWGLGPGIATALGVFLAFNYFFIEPHYSLVVHHTQDLLGLVVFLTVAVILNQWIGRARRNLDTAAGREHEALRLYEFSLQLAGLHSDQAIAEAIAQHLEASFQADRVEVFVEPFADGAPVFVRLPPGPAPAAVNRTVYNRYRQAVYPPPNRPNLIAPLQTARGLLGELRMWRAAEPLSAGEERLFRTFASQGVLALERARLAQAEARARALEESDRLKSALLSSVSHELRTPLATIKAAVTSLRSQQIDWDPADRQELLAAIEEETDHLNQVVSNLLNMSRLEAGALQPQLSWNLLSEIVAGSVAQQRRLSGGDDLPHRIEVQLPEDLPLVLVDYGLLEQVFNNLLSNSLKYSPPGSVVRISARVTADDQLLVQVSNQGPWVPPEHLERIFDKFYRVTAAEQVSGVGLGLSICKGIITAHGGRIWAENLPGGVVFNFTLPLKWEGAAPRLGPE
jgi:two-component system sensor histidine kinase KdpD